jgi:pyruvate/2-oxoacid:ferredoxin oxidoreductase beta subunit
MLDESRFAVDSGYWPLYRYRPALLNEGKNPFVLDTKKLRKDVTAFLQRYCLFEYKTTQSTIELVDY